MCEKDALHDGRILGRYLLDARRPWLMPGPFLFFVVMKKRLTYSDVLESQTCFEFQMKFSWENMFIHIFGGFMGQKDADGPDLDIDLSPEKLLETMKKSVETGEDLLLRVATPHIVPEGVVE